MYSERFWVKKILDSNKNKRQHPIMIEPIIVEKLRIKSKTYPNCRLNKAVSSSWLLRQLALIYLKTQSLLCEELKTGYYYYERIQS